MEQQITITITNDDGIDVEHEILLSFENNDNGRKYLFLVPAGATEGEDGMELEVTAARVSVFPAPDGSNLDEFEMYELEPWEVDYVQTVGERAMAEQANHEAGEEFTLEGLPQVGPESDSLVITATAPDGTEVEFEVVLVFSNDETGRNYVCFTDHQQLPDGSLNLTVAWTMQDVTPENLATGELQLMPLQDEEEIAFVQSVIEQEFGE